MCAKCKTFLCTKYGDTISNCVACKIEVKQIHFLHYICCVTIKLTLKLRSSETWKSKKKRKVKKIKCWQAKIKSLFNMLCWNTARTNLVSSIFLAVLHFSFRRCLSDSTVNTTMEKVCMLSFETRSMQPGLAFTSWASTCFLCNSSHNHDFAFRPLCFFHPSGVSHP